jgi:hypothetical protein
MHPGIPLPSAPQVKPRDLSLLVIRIPLLLFRATQEQSENLVVYLYDSTHASDENPPQFLGGAKVSGMDTNAASVESIEVQYADFEETQEEAIPCHSRRELTRESIMTHS